LLATYVAKSAQHLSIHNVAGDAVIARLATHHDAALSRSLFDITFSLSRCLCSLWIRSLLCAVVGAWQHYRLQVVVVSFATFVATASAWVRNNFIDHLAPHFVA